MEMRAAVVMLGAGIPDSRSVFSSARHVSCSLVPKMAKKVIWAVDAFESKPDAHAHVAGLLQSLAKREAIDLEAVYVLSPSQLNVPMELSGPWVAQYRPAAEAALDFVLKSNGLSGYSRSHVLVQNYSSNSEAVKALLAYANRNQVELLVSGTHARKGLERVLMGSFAETLIHHSDVPLIVVGPDGKPTPVDQVQSPVSLFSTILFPTEFRQNSKRIFRMVTQFASEVGASILLFHSVPAPLDPIVQSGAYLLGGSWIPVSTYFSDEGERSRRRAEAWADWAKNQGVSVDVTIYSQGGSVAEAVLETAAKKRVGMIALEAQTGPVASVLIGSVTRQILRLSSIPILILRQSMRVPAAKAIPKAA